MQSLSRYSRSNQINKDWIDMYLNEAHSYGLVSVRCHCNIMAWAESEQELRAVRNDVGSQLALMECKPRHNTIDAPALYWAGMPGNAGDFPAEESFYTFWNLRFASLSEKRTTRVHPARSVFAWLTVSVESLFMWIFPTYR